MPDQVHHGRSMCIQSRNADDIRNAANMPARIRFMTGSEIPRPLPKLIIRTKW
jgi:hypothetical protein